jgi:hypothetical protein
VPGSHAEDIVVDYFEAENWSVLLDSDPEPDADLPPLAPPSST